jgi:hypothetical protein
MSLEKAKRTTEQRLVRALKPPKQLSQNRSTTVKGSMHIRDFEARKREKSRLYNK